VLASNHFFWFSGILNLSYTEVAGCYQCYQCYQWWKQWQNVQSRSICTGSTTSSDKMSRLGGWISGLLSRSYIKVAGWKQWCRMSIPGPVAVKVLLVIVDIHWISRRLSRSYTQVAGWKKRSFLYLLWAQHSIYCQKKKGSIRIKSQRLNFWISRVLYRSCIQVAQWCVQSRCTSSGITTRNQSAVELTFHAPKISRPLSRSNSQVAECGSVQSRHVSSGTEYC